MDTIDTGQLQQELADCVARVIERGERAILRQNGKPVAAVIPLEDLELLEHLIEEAEDQIDVENAECILSDPDLKWIPRDEVRQRLGL